MKHSILLVSAIGVVAVLLPDATASRARRPEDYYATFQRCMETVGKDHPKASPAENNGLLAGCADDAATRAKKEIDSLYRSITARLVSQDRTSELDKLNKSQQAWVTYRDNQCSLENTLVGTPDYSYCMVMIDNQRAKDLRELAQ